MQSSQLKDREAVCDYQKQDQSRGTIAKVDLMSLPATLNYAAA